MKLLFKLKLFKQFSLLIFSVPGRIDATRNLCNALKDHAAKVDASVTRGNVLLCGTVVVFLLAMLDSLATFVCCCKVAYTRIAHFAVVITICKVECIALLSSVRL